VYWVSRERLGTLDAAAARERAVWLAQDPEHRHHYAAVQATMRQADLLDPAVLREMLADTNTRISRRRMVLGGAGACAAALLGAVALHRYRAASDPADLHATGRGERRRVVLADGSVLDLNT
ncbi:hypothetical protein RWU37_05725, partial [Enterococcus sp. 2CBP]|uniref:hypothetical protein n=1 Tax=Enterococcus sp. 2CBP TaxID=2800793 RepID=UPI0028FD5BED